MAGVCRRCAAARRDCWRVYRRERRVVGLVKPVDDKKRSLFCQFEGSAPLSFLEQGRIAEDRTELFRPFIAGNLAGQRLEASAISASQDDSPFMFELPGFAGNFVGARSLNHGYLV
jgi:hypothetical protein